MQDPDSGPFLACSSTEALNIPEGAPSAFAAFHAALLPDAARFLDGHGLLHRTGAVTSEMAAGLVAALMVHRGGAFPDKGTAFELLDMAETRIMQVHAVYDAAAGHGALLMNGGYYYAGESTTGEGDDLDAPTTYRRAA